MPVRVIATNGFSSRNRLTPPTSAIPISPRRSAWQAKSKATNDAEQAVSTTNAGPRRSRK